MSWIWFAVLCCIMDIAVSLTVVWIVLRVVIQPMVSAAVKTELKRRDAVVASMLRHPSARQPQQQRSQADQ